MSDLYDDILNQLEIHGCTYQRLRLVADVLRVVSLAMADGRCTPAFLEDTAMALQSTYLVDESDE